MGWLPGNRSSGPFGQHSASRFVIKGNEGVYIKRNDGIRRRALVTQSYCKAVNECLQETRTLKWGGGGGRVRRQADCSSSSPPIPLGCRPISLPVPAQSTLSPKCIIRRCKICRGNSRNLLEFPRRAWLCPRHSILIYEKVFSRPLYSLYH